jgi:nucleotide-binding universal stress UspA family protein
VITVPTALTPAVQRAGTSSILEAFYEYAVKDATDYVNNLAEEAKGLGVSSARGEVERAPSSPATAIADKARSDGADIIVIGSRGLDATRRFILGSVSAGVVASSEIQVLVVR